MRHHSLPQTSTPEQLAEWIQLNKVDTFNHEEKIQLTEEEIQNFEHQSALASRQIMKLTDVEKYFKELIKKGTPYSMEKEAHEPINVTIPPTKGKDALTANMEFANKQLELGYKLDITHLYLVPNPEESAMVMVDIEGVEWPDYSREMTKDEINQHKPLLRGSHTVTLSGGLPDGFAFTTGPSEYPENGTEKRKKAKKEDFTGDLDL